MLTLTIPVIVHPVPSARVTLLNPLEIRIIISGNLIPGAICVTEYSPEIDDKYEFISDTSGKVNVILSDGAASYINPYTISLPVTTSDAVTVDKVLCDINPLVIIISLFIITFEPTLCVVSSGGGGNTRFSHPLNGPYKVAFGNSVNVNRSSLY